MVEYKELVTKECYYCAYYNKKEAIGIDRVNNTLYYTKENCVPCCETCNRIKSFYHPSFFINKAKIICNIITLSYDFYQKWQIYYSRSVPNNYLKYKKEAEEKRNLNFKIKPTEWEKLIRQPCYLCGYSQAVGIGLDRVDNTIREYNIENCKPCCGSCNNMKNDMNYNDFINHLLKITIKWNNNNELDIVPLFGNPLKNNIKINIETNEIIENKKERKHWTRNGLYQSILSNKYNEFITKYKEFIKDNEIENIIKEVHNEKNKEIAIQKLATFLNTLNMRRKRAKKGN